MYLKGVIKLPSSLREWVKESFLPCSSSRRFFLRFYLLTIYGSPLSWVTAIERYDPLSCSLAETSHCPYSLVKIRSQLPKVVGSGHCQASPFSDYPVRGCRFAVRANVRLRSVFTVNGQGLYTFTALPSVLSLISSTVYSIAHFLTLCNRFFMIFITFGVIYKNRAVFCAYCT